MFYRYLRLARDAFVLYNITDMVKQIAAQGVNSFDIRQITIRLPAAVLAKLDRLAAHAVQTKSQFLIKLLQEVPDIEAVEPVTELTELQQRICAWFHRKPSTRWTEKEKAAYRKNAHNTSAEDVDILERYYTAKFPEETDYRRRDIGTLLNHWPGELDRARTFVAAISKKRTAVGQGWISSNVIHAENGRNLTPDEVKAGVMELRAKMGLPLVPKSQITDAPDQDDLEGVDL